MDFILDNLLTILGVLGLLGGICYLIASEKFL